MAEISVGEKGWGDLLAQGRLPRFALICLGVWLNAADALVTATIMPSVGLDLGGYGYFSWSVAGFLVGAILAGASAGRLSELFGLRAATALAGREGRYIWEHGDIWYTVKGQGAPLVLIHGIYAGASSYEYRRVFELLAHDPDNAPLAPGEIVSTGTLTRALPVKPGETWTTKLKGIDLEGASLRFA